MFLPTARVKTELIEVVRITEHMSYSYSEGMVGTEAAIWEAEQAQEPLDLIADLPQSEPYRCFTPGWGVRAHSATDLLFEIAFCFKCHGARLWGESVPEERVGIHTFDPESPAGRELLQRFRACAPAQDANAWRE